MSKLGRFSRTELLLGEAGMEKLAKSTVAIFGVGGVGSFVAEGLARAGVGHLVLIDNDLICLTNINRQIHATSKTVGKKKTETMKERIPVQIKVKKINGLGYSRLDKEFAVE